MARLIAGRRAADDGERGADCDRQAPTDETFFRMVRLATRDPAVRRHFIAILAATNLPLHERTAILLRFLAAGLEESD